MKNQALLVIDAQQELIDGNQNQNTVFMKEKLVNNINLVVEKALKSKALVIFVRDLDVSKGKGEGFQIHQNINIPENSKIFDKKATNAFYGTKLKSYLHGNHVKHLVIMGCKTEHCIDTAVRSATINHFDVTLVKDGHSTSDTSTLSADQIIHHHNEILHGHYNIDHFSLVRSAQEDLFTPTHDRYR
ncbi:isochorismatase family protein [Chengkuizengella sp. YPA3-1-1]|uniref:Isochorismatase family protein n=1 Tax=Chengkuizengella marina TaxID=2507566 RepID=A0A6N9Q559_9BACL|nr:isochorismatase family protein [Chengkuizengella marina]